MPRLIAAFIRHGDYHQPPGVPSAHLPYGLSDVGEKQAREEAEKLRHHATEQGWEVHPELYCSRMRRAYETARIFQRVLGEGAQQFSVLETDALAERCVGAAANLTQDQIVALVAEDPRYDPLPDGWKADAQVRLPFQGAESLLDAGHRVATFVEQRLSTLEATIDRDTLHLFIGHGGAFRHAATVLGLLELSDVKKLSMHHCKPVYCERRAGAKYQHVFGDWKHRRTTTD